MRYWVFTSKPQSFDMTGALIPGQTLDWPTFARFKFEVGDIVFIYASTPVLQLIGKLEIEEIGLEFKDVDPRNDLRKWPKWHSSIPWMRMRVLQAAPVPFKPLQRGSLYYHTEFKPSPYPKLLHEKEIPYVLRAFEEAMTYTADSLRYEGGFNPEALKRVSGGEILAQAAETLKGGILSKMQYIPGELLIELKARSEDEPVILDFHLGGVVRVRWEHQQDNHVVTGIRLTLEDTYLLLNIDGVDLEILAQTLTLDPDTPEDNQ